MRDWQKYVGTPKTCKQCGKIFKHVHGYKLGNHCSEQCIRKTEKSRLSDRFYKVWYTMKRRCSEPTDRNYKYYGARGIRVCSAWHTYQNFKDDMLQTYAPGLTIDRIDGKGDYEPKNCRWITQQDQMQNISTNIHLEYNGETRTIRGWSDLVGIPYHTLYTRYRSGWSTDRVLNTAPRRSKADLLSNKPE